MLKTHPAFHVNFTIKLVSVHFCRPFVKMNAPRSNEHRLNFYGLYYSLVLRWGFGCRRQKTHRRPICLSRKQTASCGELHNLPHYSATRLTTGMFIRNTTNSLQEPGWNLMMSYCVDVCECLYVVSAVQLTKHFCQALKSIRLSKYSCLSDQAIVGREQTTYVEVQQTFRLKRGKYGFILLHQLTFIAFYIFNLCFL